MSNCTSVDDLAQEAILKVPDALNFFDDSQGTTFSAYFYIICNNVLADERRRQPRQKRGGNTFSIDGADSEGSFAAQLVDYREKEPEEIVETRDSYQQLMGSVVLNEKERDIIRKRFAGSPTPEIAKSLSCSVYDVKNWFRAAMTRLHEAHNIQR